MRLFISFFVLILISACSSSYDDLSSTSFKTSSIISKHLFNEYKSKADFEAKKMHDWNSAKLYSEKALRAAKGMKIKPEKIHNWKIPKEKIKELKISYENLMLVYDDALSLNPYNLAVAISSLDCWAEQQEENWQTDHIAKCKNDFLKAMYEIHNSIELNKKKEVIQKNKKSESKKETVSLVTKNDNEEILQIIYFDFDKYELSKVSLNLIKKFIEKNKKIINKFLIVGHTDSKGSKKYNIDLSIDRAKAVKEILVKLGINEKDVKIIGRGEEELLVKTQDEVKHPTNRRAEIKPLN